MPGKHPWFIRAGIFLFSAGAFGAGVVATFTTDNEVGSSTMMLIGAAGGIVALLGYVPTFKVGGLEVDATAVYRAGITAGALKVEEAVEEAVENNSSPEEILHVATTTASTAPVAFTDFATYLGYWDRASQHERQLRNEALTRWLNQDPADQSRG